MKTYDMICPVCGHENHNLYLEATDGWMECENCNQVTKNLMQKPKVRIPVIAFDTIKRNLAV